MRTIAIANQKGGCGKTTTAVNLSAALAGQGYSVLLIDLDSQGHATLALGYEPQNLDKTIYDVINDSKLSMSWVVLETAIRGLRLVPSNILLSGAEVELSPLSGREYVLSRRLESIRNNYDICIIDCSPSLGLLVLNALVAADEVIIPVQVHYYALEGMRQLLETITIVRERFNRHLKIRGILLTFVENKTILSSQIQKQMRAFFDDLVFSTVIHRTVHLAEAPSAGESILTYAPASRGAAEYKVLASEVI